LTAALAAAAGAVGFSHSSLASPAPANNAVDVAALSATMGQTQLSAVTTARIERRQLATRDNARGEVTVSPARKKQAAAASIAKARAAKLAALRTQANRRANALALAKAAAEKAEQAANRAEFMLSCNYNITATFGMGGARWARNHTGTDFSCPYGSRIGAVMRGKVIAVGWAGAYGNQVSVEHDDGTVTTYSHMSDYAVEVGDYVYAGDKVGEVGSTGNSTGNHLHFEVHEDGVQIDPMPWLQDHGIDP
jgi:murein DD-endopeptidase MepM/ murein hydrolase activator NlpD